MLEVELLSKREKQCLVLLARGLRYQQIAFQLGQQCSNSRKADFFSTY